MFINEIIPYNSLVHENCICIKILFNNENVMKVHAFRGKWCAFRKTYYIRITPRF